MPRFVLLLHDCPDGRPRATHCDLMLEVGAALETWALELVPRAWDKLDIDPRMLSTSNTVDAERLADHRLAYLEYEGPVSGDRGHVRRLDEGSYRPSPSPMLFSLEGRSIRGEIEIVPPHDAHGSYRLAFRGTSAEAASVCPSM
ncbi:MAG: hypothetical protein AB7G28_07440 [Pirellulales bacterium]